MAIEHMVPKAVGKVRIFPADNEVGTINDGSAFLMDSESRMVCIWIALMVQVFPTASIMVAAMVHMVHDGDSA